jgi:hypothetical protein
MTSYVKCIWTKPGYPEPVRNLEYYDPLQQLARERPTDHPGLPYHVLDAALEEEPVKLFQLSAAFTGVYMCSDLDAGLEGEPGYALKAIKCEPDTSVLTKEQQIQLEQILDEFQDVFSSGPSDIGRVTDEICHRIQVKENCEPIKTNRPIASYSHHEREYLKQEAPRLLDLGIIRHSTSPWVSAPVLPRKSDGSLRLCIDFRPLNAVTVSDPYPMPVIQELITQMREAKFFSRLDVTSAFWQIPMHPEHIKYTGFITPDGKYEWVRMPFGLKNASSSWQRFADRMLDSTPFAVAYLDDVFIFSNNWELHKLHLKHSFSRFRQYNVKMKLVKCIFGAASIRCLGYIVGFGTSTPDPEKVAAIRMLPPPRDATGVRRILGATGYYRDYIKGYAHISAPLADLTKKNVVFEWTLQRQEAFQSLKHALTTEPVLRLPDFNRPFILTTDWSKVAIGAVLSQEDPVTHFDHPVAYASRLLSAAERNYASTEGECLALVWAVQKFRLYLDGKEFIVYTDNSALQWLHTARHQNSKVERWMLKLQEFNFVVRYKKGVENVVADCLSRNIADTPEDNVFLVHANMAMTLTKCITQSIEQEAMCTISSAKAFPSQAVQLQRKIENTPCVACGDPKGEDNIAICPGCERFYHLRCLRPSRSVVPGGDWYCPACAPFFAPERYDRIRELENQQTPLVLHDFDPYRDQDLLNYVRAEHQPDIIEHLPTRTIANIRRRGAFYKRHPDLDDWLIVFKKLRYAQPKWLICPPLHFRWDIIGMFHDATGHAGISQTLYQLHRHYHWVGIKDDVVTFVSNCETCQKVKASPPVPPDPQIPVIHGPLEHVHIDLIGPFDSRTGKKVWVCMMIDYFTKALEMAVVATKEPGEIAVAFYDTWVCRYGCPSVVTTDNGTEFQTAFKHLLDRIGAHHINTSVAHPESNGAVERVNQTIKRKIKSHCNDNTTNWEKMLPQIRQAYMNSRHSSTGFSPNQMLFGQALKLPVAVRDAVAMSVNLQNAEHMLNVVDRKQFMNDKAWLAIRMRQFRHNNTRFRKTSNKDICVGDSVFELVQPKSPLHTSVKGPFRVVSVSFDKTHATLVTGETAARRKQFFRRHTSHLVKMSQPSFAEGGEGTG